MRLSGSDFTQLLLALALLLGVAHVFGAAFVRIRQPRVMGELLGGALLGPSCLSGLFPALGEWLSAGEGARGVVLSGVQQLGMVLVMYAAGLEMRDFAPRSERRLVAALAAGGMLIPFAAGAVAVRWLDLAPLLGPAHHSGAFALVFACAIAVTSISVISRIMLDLGVLESRFARVVLSTAVVEDLVLYVVLAVALTLAGAGASAATDPSTSPYGQVGVAAYHSVVTAAFVILTLRFGRRPSALVLGRHAHALGGPAAAELLLLLALTGVAARLGITPMMGALVAGMVASSAAPARSEASGSIIGFSMVFFVPIYFVMIGLRLDLVHDLDVLWFGAFLALGCLVKMLSVYAAARLAGQQSWRARCLAVALNARGGPAIVMATIALEAGIISNGFFVTLVLTAVVTSLMAGAYLSGHSPQSLDGGGERPDATRFPARKSAAVVSART